MQFLGCFRLRDLVWQLGIWELQKSLHIRIVDSVDGAFLTTSVIVEKGNASW